MPIAALITAAFPLWVLARANFANPAVAIPSAISSLFHSLLASLLAAWRGRRLPEKR